MKNPDKAKIAADCPDWKKVRYRRWRLTSGNKALGREMAAKRLSAAATIRLDNIHFLCYGPVTIPNGGDGTLLPSDCVCPRLPQSGLIIYTFYVIYIYISH